MRFSEAPVIDDSTFTESGSIPVSTTPIERETVGGVAAEIVGQTDENPTAKRSSGERDRARKLIEDIGCEFVRLRKRGRPQAFAELEDKLMQSAHVLVESGLMSVDQWIKTTISLEEYRRAEGGNVEAAGDILARWLSEEEKPKRSKRKPSAETN